MAEPGGGFGGVFPRVWGEGLCCGIGFSWGPLGIRERALNCWNEAIVGYCRVSVRFQFSFAGFCAGAFIGFKKVANYWVPKDMLIGFQGSSLSNELGGKTLGSSIGSRAFRYKRQRAERHLISGPWVEN